MAIIAAGRRREICVAVAVFALQLTIFAAPAFLPFASTVVAGGRPTRQTSRPGIRSLVRAQRPRSPDQIAVQAVEKTWHAVTDSVAGISQVPRDGKGADYIAGVVGIAQNTAEVFHEGT